MILNFNLYGIRDTSILFPFLICFALNDLEIRQRVPDYRVSVLFLVDIAFEYDHFQAGLAGTFHPFFSGS